ncbi:MAG: InlB B-repeat-containing protein [Spirochaetaceae bacterium]|jgi:uncharacterized repeat protein (TIGR02543 family)|nr:InlB B-repeat-containing protein [Spirochaetaceae bacterium]
MTSLQRKTGRPAIGLLAVIGIAAYILTGCPPESNEDSSPTVTGVTITAAEGATSVVKGRTLQFTAVVDGTNSPDQTVIWEVTGGAAEGTIIHPITGLLKVAAGETAANLTVKATSMADAAKSNEKTITVTFDVVTVTAPDDSVVQGGTLQFRSDPAEVMWTVTGGATGTSINSAGLLTVARGETATALTITATAQSKSGTKTVTVSPAKVTVTGVTVTAEATSVVKADTLQFSAVVEGDSPPQTVTWTVSGGGTGTSINSAGLLTAAAGETALMLTVKATSIADTTRFGILSITVRSIDTPVNKGVAIAPATYTIAPGGTKAFTATPAEVTWKVEGGGTGTDISDEGLLTVAEDETADTLRITATGKTDATKFGTAIVTVSPPDEPTYKVTFVSNGGSTTTPQLLLKTGAEVATEPIVTKFGYVYDGWYEGTLDGNFDPSKKWYFETLVTRDLILCAKWNPAIYGITYVLNGDDVNTASLGSGSPTSYEYEPATVPNTAKVTLVDPTRTNYIFQGWYKEPTFENKVTAIMKGSTTSETFYAKWGPRGGSSFAYYWLNEDELRLSVSRISVSSTGSLTIMPEPTATPYTSHTWYLNGVPDTAATGNTYSFSGAGKAADTRYTVGLRVVKGDQVYFDEIIINITN